MSGPPMNTTIKLSNNMCVELFLILNSFSFCYATGIVEIWMANRKERYPEIYLFWLVSIAQSPRFPVIAAQLARNIEFHLSTVSHARRIIAPMTIIAPTRRVSFAKFRAFYLVDRVKSVSEKWQLSLCKINKLYILFSIKYFVIITGNNGYARGDKLPELTL